MIRFRKRSCRREMIDEEDGLDAAQWARVLEELDQVNRYLGGTRSLLLSLEPWLGQMKPEQETVLVDVGCGSGDIARVLVERARSRGRRLRIVALDRQHEVCRRARQAVSRYPEILVVRADARALPLRRRGCDLIYCSAFLHHFAGAELERLVSDCCRHARLGFVISDLHRHPLAYFGFRLLSLLFSRSPVIRHDGPISVLRGFRRQELLGLAARAGVRVLRLRWCWAFRWLLVVASPHKSAHTAKRTRAVCD